MANECGYERGDGMTIDDFLKKYNRCPFCLHYTQQGNHCYRCMWRFANGKYANVTCYDGFDPNEEWTKRMNREVTE